MKVDNAIIMAAGVSSRFAPLSFEKHKAMTVVKGEVLIERQIRQLQEAGIQDIYIVVGYKKEQFSYLVEKYGVKLINNPDYLIRNNNGSIWVARHVLKNSYICSSDNYFAHNPFTKEVDCSYYAAEYSKGHTLEWCMSEGDNGYIDSVTVGGSESWYMLGHTFWSEDFSSSFLSILESEYDKKETIDKLWENIFIEHLDILKMKIKKYEPGIIYEFDTMNELREFDPSYITNTQSTIIKKVSILIGTTEDKIVNINAIKDGATSVVGFMFDCGDNHYNYFYNSGELKKYKK